MPPIRGSDPNADVRDQYVCMLTTIRSPAGKGTEERPRSGRVRRNGLALQKETESDTCQKRSPNGKGKVNHFFQALTIWSLNLTSLGR